MATYVLMTKLTPTVAYPEFLGIADAVEGKPG